MGWEGENYTKGCMRYEIILSREAIGDLRSLNATIRSTVKLAIERHLRYEPTKVSKSRIKRLRGIKRPQYRLRMDDIRILYDVQENVVEVIAIIPKTDQSGWLRSKGEASETDHDNRVEG